MWCRFYYSFITIVRNLSLQYNYFMSKKDSKKIFVVLTLIFDVITLLLIPVEFLFFNVPAILAVLMVIASLVLNTLLIVKTKIKKLPKIILTIFTLFVSLIVLFDALLFPYWNSKVFKLNVNNITKNYDSELSQKEALDDLDYAYYYFKKIHPAMRLKSGSDFKMITDAYNSAREKICEKENIRVVELYQLIEGMFSLLRDAHTNAWVNYEEPHYLKYVNAINKKNYTFAGVNGILYKDLLKEKNNLYSYEKEEWAISDLADDSITIEGLVYLGFDISKDITYLLKSESCENKDYDSVQNATKYDFLTYKEYREYNNLNPNPTYSSFVSYTIDEEYSLAVLKLDSCTNNDEYKTALKNMFTEVKEKNIKNVAVDVRSNGGGSSLVINSFFKYLDIDDFYEASWIERYGPFEIKHKNPHRKNHRKEDLIFDGNVFVLTSKKSFSSAMMFPEYVKDNNIGKIIGEAPANDPNGYGDVVRFVLPNSRISMQISRSKFVRINQDTTEKFVEPDYPCDSDKVMEVLYELLEDKN